MAKQASMDDEIKERDELTAVIIADSFTRSFWPITNDMPKVLMPMCNIPLIEYTIELVIRNHIKKIILFCCSQAQKIVEYIQLQKYRQVSIQCICRPSCVSLGDVVRELDSRKFLRNDFLIIYGDTVGNANLKEAIEHHRNIRKTDKEYILTVVFSEVSFDSNLRTEEEQSIVVLEGPRILQFDGIMKKRKIDLNSNVKFKDLKEFEIRNDLVESGVLICSPEIMEYFSGEFDYHSLRDHLMRDLLTSEIYSVKCSAYVLPKHSYLHRVQVPKTYDTVSVDMMNRWLYPICLDANLFPPSTPSTYTSSRNNLYKETGVQVSRTAKIESPAVIGAKTVIHDEAVISMSSIGRNCIIGSGCKISGSYIWNDVTIGKNCQITHALICNGVTIGDNCIINPGSVISTNVKLKDSLIIEECSRISLYKYNQTDEIYQLCNETSELGNGYLYDAQLENRLHGVNKQLLRKQSIGAVIINICCAKAEDSPLSDSSPSDSENEKIVDTNKFMPKESNFYIEFIDEVKNLVAEMVERDETVESIQIEVNSIKFSQNKDFMECISGILAGLIESSGPKLSLHFEKWTELLGKYACSDLEKKHMLKELERLMTGRPEQGQFHLVVKEIYAADVIDGDCILTWNEECTSDVFKGLMKQFVEWLEEDEEEEDEEDEDD